MAIAIHWAISKPTDSGKYIDPLYVKKAEHKEVAVVTKQKANRTEFKKAMIRMRTRLWLK